MAANVARVCGHSPGRRGHGAIMVTKALSLGPLTIGPRPKFAVPTKSPATTSTRSWVAQRVVPHLVHGLNTAAATSSRFIVSLDSARMLSLLITSFFGLFSVCFMSPS